MRGTQLELFGSTVDENQFVSELWGVLQFYPTRTDDMKETCQKCLLRCLECSEECAKAKCTTDQRRDKRNGYYSIHQMPKQRNVVLPHCFLVGWVLRPFVRPIVLTAPVPPSPQTPALCFTPGGRFSPYHAITSPPYEAVFDYHAATQAHHTRRRRSLGYASRPLFPCWLAWPRLRREAAVGCPRVQSGGARGPSPAGVGLRPAPLVGGRRPAAGAPPRCFAPGPPPRVASPRAGLLSSPGSGPLRSFPAPSWAPLPAPAALVGCWPPLRGRRGSWGLCPRPEASPGWGAALRAVADSAKPPAPPAGARGCPRVGADAQGCPRVYAGARGSVRVSVGACSSFISLLVLAGGGLRALDSACGSVSLPCAVFAAGGYGARPRDILLIPRRGAMPPPSLRSGFAPLRSVRGSVRVSVGACRSFISLLVLTGLLNLCGCSRVSNVCPSGTDSQRGGGLRAVADTFGARFVPCAVSMSQRRGVHWRGATGRALGVFF